MFAPQRRRTQPHLGARATALAVVDDVNQKLTSPGFAPVPIAGFCAFVLLAAMLAFCAPIGVKVLAVLLLAGPHNWVEFRYFLSRLPSRWPGQIRSFFLLSLAGLATLGLGNIALMWALNASVISWQAAHFIYGIWAVLACSWSVGLFFIAASVPAGAERGHRKRLLAGSGLCMAFAAFAAVQPTLFGVALVYAHPLISLVILDRELARSKPRWQPDFRFGLALIPIIVCSFWFSLSATQFVPQGAVAQHIVNQTGASLLFLGGSAFWLSTLVFLDLLHYAVWLVAIPNWAAGWRRWQPTKDPAIVTRFPAARLPVKAALVVASLLVIGLWIGFSKDYVAASQIYFVVAIMHVLAEVPFLAWASR